jgi:hypothetical protein
MLGDPALWVLARLKLRGVLRKQVRRLDRPSSVIFAAVGLLLLAGWLSALALRGHDAVIEDPRALRDAICAGALLLAAMTGFSALGHRGLYLPASELELLLAAPVSRASLVRFRVLSSSGRALLGGVVIGLIASRHVPQPVFGFLGGFLGALLLPAIGQGVSLLAGGAENRWAERLMRSPLRWLGLLAVIGILLLALPLTGAGSLGGLGRWLRDLALGERLRAGIEHPLVVFLGLPFRPWARMMTASSLHDFAPWAALGIALHVALVEAVARIPVDFRELSLATSADVARRLRRFQRSGSTAFEPSRTSAGRRVPWLFGRGPTGAVAWRKSAAILRKARGTLFVGAAIVALLTLLSTVIDDLGEEGAQQLGPLIVAAVGTVYLCAGLRFDFREDLDQMEVIKSWPVRPWKLFLATILPQVALVSGFIVTALALRALLVRDARPGQLVIAGLVPLLAYTWSAIDNALYLYAPIRYTPGQEGALHHAGRAMTLMLVRMLCFAAALFVGVAGVLLALLLQSLFDVPDLVVGVVGATLGCLALASQLAGLTWLGGALLRRFDVARDRG